MIARGITRAEIARRNGEAAMKHGRNLADAAKAADQGLRQAFAAFDDIRATVIELNKLGCNHPSLNLVDVDLRRALINASMGSGYALGHLAPGERHTIGELGMGWAAGISTWAQRQLDEPASEAA